MSTLRTLVWFRGKDLRIADHAPLGDAAAAGEVIPLFVLDPYFFAPARARELPHRMQYLLGSLRELEANIAQLGSRLVVVAGKSTEVVPALAKKWNVTRVVAQRWVEPFARERDRKVREALHVPFELYEGETLLPPGTLRSQGGQPYAILTPFARAFLQTITVGKPLVAPKSLPPLPRDVTEKSAPIPSCEDLGITPNPHLVEAGEAAAHQRLKHFVKSVASDYATARDRMDMEGTSRLSQDLKFGTLSPRQVWTAAEAVPHPHAYLNELTWREFTHSTLWDRPELLAQPFQSGFVGFPWSDNAEHFEAWAKGRTGYPIVDASARQLLGEGFVHNRARMISASFLCKHLLISYRRGEVHYLKYLTDGDWAQNNAGWQWSAGCGCDAQPYFRVFNPMLQGQKFDPEGDYVKRWVPELARLPGRYIHQPWTTPASVLREAGLQLGRDYPLPIVEHTAARERFLSVAKHHLSRTRTKPA